MVYRTPIHGISNPLPMVYRNPYPWYLETPNHGISNPLFMVYQTPISMVCQTPYPWYIEHHTHDILTPSLWYIESPTYLMIRNEWVQNTTRVQFTIQLRFIFNKGVQYTMNENWPLGQYSMGFKISYDTGLKYLRK